LGVSVGRAEIKIPLPGDCSGLIPHTHKAPSPIHSTRKEKEKKKKGMEGGRKEEREEETPLLTKSNHPTL
jgi:hypothetical protein